MITAALFIKGGKKNHLKTTQMSIKERRESYGIPAYWTPLGSENAQTITAGFGADAPLADIKRKLQKHAYT